MKVGVRSKLFAATLGPVIVVGSVCGYYLHEVLRRHLDDALVQTLSREADAACVTLEAMRDGDDAENIDATADRLGAAFVARVTVVAPDGRVLGDSEVPLDGLARLDNHAARPEIALALTGDAGLARRYSRTLRTGMLYVARSYGRPDGTRGVVRLAEPSNMVEALRLPLRLALLVAAMFGLVLAAAISALSAHVLSRTLRRLVDSAHTLARGLGAPRLSTGSGDELGRLAGSFNRLADDLDRTVGELASERDRLQTILDGMSDAVLALDARDEIVLVNDAAMQLLRLMRSPLGRSLLETVRSPELAALGATREVVGEPVELDLVGPPLRRVSARAAPLPGGRGTVIVMHDVTEMRRLETIRRDFVANVSHELRTPVSIIRANAETLLDGALDDVEHARTFVEASLRHAVRLSSLIDDLLDLARIEAERYGIEVAPIVVAPVAHRAVAALSAAIADAGHALEVAVDPALVAMADARALEHVIINLLDNAIKYTPPGGHLAIRGTSTGGRIRVSVHDDGPGIPRVHRERVFERFYRVDPGRSREMGGTGLGLSIVRHLGDAMGAEVGVTPGEPRGSVFWIELRAATAIV